MRSRSRYKSFSKAHVRNTVTSTGAETLYSTYPVKIEYESMIDTLTKDFGHSKRRGLLPQNFLSYTCQRDEGDIYAMRRYLNSAHPLGQTLEGPLTPWMMAVAFGVSSPPPMPSYNLASMEAAAKARCLARFDRPHNSFGEPLAELRRTVETIRHPLRSAADFLKRFHKRRSRLTNAKHAIKATASTYAEIAFGIAPAIRSADDAVNAYIKRNVVQPTYGKCYGSETVHLGPVTRVIGSPLSWNGYICYSHYEKEITAKVKAGIIFSSTDAGSRSAMLGLRVRDWPSVAWELIPLSFLVDRVINVKGFLSASTSLLSSSVHVHGGYITTRVTDKSRFRYTDIRLGNIPTRKWDPCDSRWHTQETFSYGRVKWKPTVADAVPKFDNRLFDSIQSTLDLTSIVLGRLKIKK